MVDSRANVDLNSGRKDSDGRVKILMDRTPSFLKSKFLSVLGNRNDLINGLTTKLDISANLSSSSGSQSNDFESNPSKATHSEEASLDENLTDFESRDVKKRRALEEVSFGRYRHPNFLQRFVYPPRNDVCRYIYIDMNPESSECASNSNSAISKTPTSITLADDALKNETADTNQTHESENQNVSCLTIPAEHICSSCEAHSEFDIQQANMSEASAEGKQWNYSNSDHSLQSLRSIASLESQCEEDTLEFMKRYVNILFENCAQLTLELKSEFGLKSQTEIGRRLFARLVSAQRSNSKRVNENTFYSLIQHFAIVLFECNENDDFSPAKILMNMCFTFFHEVDVPGCEPYREYLYTYLRYQPIWQAIRFWNAAYFHAIQCERNRRPTHHLMTIISAFDSSDDEISSGKKSARNHLVEYVRENLDSLDDDDEQILQRNICFGQLGAFTCNMHAFGLSKELCYEFLRKQSVTANLTKDQEKVLHENINRMYREIAKWRNN